MGADGRDASRRDAIVLGADAYLPASRVNVRTTTSGGPGGQHANRTRSRVSLSAAWDDVVGLDDAQRAGAVARTGAVVRTASSRFRSQQQNREAALERLGARMRAALDVEAPRRPTRPPRRAAERRLEDKRATAQRKSWRRPPDARE